ncbi:MULTISPECIES: sigma-70 family RNA polymerase sigma factor [unclassified Streptomyces]|uniref:sigma-70 family RNA polymerase sigma factor n=1 Tax=unclassified Streptomyces TaxID=2593676 RepID=UPI002E7FC4B8|nr:sigma-70 family RNA polymerase sigma factor [Streptomyces sp. NBC_00589]WTI38269.1 sigma-70 family RNA polymerase sigma factor [Streptomyces sp. NBC_00775]WUB28052.1 sigma-70 family RNA polymerase sigma factor [Streptomyces sp. NBC_00589]
MSDVSGENGVNGVNGGAFPGKGEHEFLAERFESHRSHLRAVAYRMLGSLTEADDAVQEAWLKLSRVDAARVDNLGGWLTTVVGRVCLDLLRSRRTRGEESLEEQPGVRMPEPVISPFGGIDPEQEALLADSVGLALLVVLEQLAPAERLAFVLHDLFAVPFDEIAPIVGRTPAASRQLASRARRRVQGGAPAPDPDLAQQREVVEAFLAAARDGDFDALVAVLDPDVVARSEAGVTAGAIAVASGASSFAHLARIARPALVNGAAGFVVVADGRPVSVLAFTVVRGRIAVIDILNDPERLAGLDVTVLDR